MLYTGAMRQVHARLDEKSAAALEYLNDLLGCSEADAVRQGLRLYASTMAGIDQSPRTKQFAQAISGLGSKPVPSGVEQNAQDIRPVEKVARKAEQSAHREPEILHDVYYEEIEPPTRIIRESPVIREECGHVHAPGMTECAACEALQEVEA